MNLEKRLFVFMAHFSAYFASNLFFFVQSENLLASHLIRAAMSFDTNLTWLFDLVLTPVSGEEPRFVTRKILYLRQALFNLLLTESTLKTRSTRLLGHELGTPSTFLRISLWKDSSSLILF